MWLPAKADELLPNILEYSSSGVKAPTEVCDLCVVFASSDIEVAEDAELSNTPRRPNGSEDAPAEVAEDAELSNSTVGPERGPVEAGDAWTGFALADIEVAEHAELSKSPRRPNGSENDPSEVFEL